MDIINEIVRQLGDKPLWENWYIREKIGSGAFSAVYKVEAVRQSRTDFSALKIEPITADGKIFTDEAQKKSTLERKKEIIENESSIMYKLRSCPNIVQYEDELIRELYVNGVFEGYYTNP